MKRILVMIALALGVASWPRVEAQRRLFSTGTPAEVAQARAIGLDHVRALGSRKGIGGANDLVATSAHIDRQSMAHTRVQQYYRGVPVLGGEAIAHMNADGAAFDDTDNLVEGISVNTTPRLAPEGAIAIATTDYGCSTCLTAAPKADLWVLRDQGVDHLVYRVQLTRLDGSNEIALPVRFVDAHGGYVVLGYDNLQTGTGNSLYSGNVTIGTRFSPALGAYAMENHTLRVGTFDMMGANSTVFPFADANDVWNGSTQRAGVDAQYAMEKYFDFMSTVFGRNGIDGAGGPFYGISDDGVTPLVASLVHYSPDFPMGYNNAFWSGFVVYGDGDGVQFGPLVTVDIAGHEMTHGVTQYTANLVYEGEAGALNESWSDVFGAMLERHLKGQSASTWLLAEQAYTPGTAGDALRFMDNPHQASNKGFTADDDPDHYTERYTGASDNGGVHVNSGIPNKVFYLLAKGGTHHLGGSMTGIGADAAAQTWFDALTSYMTSSTDFAGARTATLQAATALYGSSSVQHAAVEDAWCLAGVGACHVQAVSVSPGSGSGVTQTFTLAYSDSLGAAADLKSAQVRFGPANVGSCTIQYNAITDKVRILDDAGAAGEWKSFGSGTIFNSQCTLDLALSSATPSSNNLTLTLRLTFTPSFAGLKTIYMRGNSDYSTSVWQTRGTFNVGAILDAVSIAPNSGTGVTQTFIALFSDSLGATADLKSAQVRFGPTNVGFPVSFKYNAMTDKVRILDDAGAPGPFTSFGPGMLSNSQCTLNLALSSATPSGNDLTLNLRVTFKAPLRGTNNIYMRANSNFASTSRWQARGTFTVGATVTANSITPINSTGAAQIFTLAFSDSEGVTADLKVARVRFRAVGGGPACIVDYDAMTNQVRIQRDDGSWTNFKSFGTATPLVNSQCTLNLVSSSAAPSGTNLTLTLDLAFTPAFAGAKDVYMRANSNVGSTTDWVNRGQWTVP